MNPAEPIPVIPLEYAKPSTLPRLERRWLVVAQFALVLSAVDVLVGWLLIWMIDAETVLATAPILFLLGLLLIVASWRLRLMVTVMLGLAHCSICLLFTMLVNVQNWGPRQSTTPFTIMAGAYLLVVVAPVTVVAWRRLRAMAAAATTTSRETGDLPSAAGVAEDKA